MTVSPQVDILVDGVWTDITTDIRQQSGITIGRGGPDWRSSITPSRCDLTIDNTGGVYCPRNPLSPYFGKIGRNTQLRVSNIVAEEDFSTSASNGWGSTPGGLAWSTAGGASSVYSKGSGVGIIAAAAVNTAYATYLGDVLMRDCTVAVTVAPGVVATGGPIDMSIPARRSGVDNFYYGVVRANDDALTDILIVKRVGGVPTILTIEQNCFAYDADTLIRAEFSLARNRLVMRMWDVDDPTTLVEIEATDTDLPDSFNVGCRVALSSLNTNTLPLPVEYSDFQCLDVRFTGEVAAWPQTWDPTGNNVTAPVEAAGISRRRTSTLRSALNRVITARTWETEHTAGQLLSYWPLEDAAGSTQAASGIGLQPMDTRTGITFASADGPDGSQPLPDINTSTGRLTGHVARHIVLLDSGWWVFLVFKGEAAGAAQVSPLEVIAGGDIPNWRLTVSNSSLSWVGRDADGVSQVTATLAMNLLDGEWHTIICQAYQDTSTQVSATVYIDGTDTDSDTDTTHTLGPALRVLVPSATAPSSMTSAQAGHVAVFHIDGDDPVALFNSGDHVAAMNGHAGELAGDRVARLCGEENIPYLIVGDTADTAAVGPQRVAALLDLLQDCEGVDRGILFEPWGMVGYGYRTRASMYNQSPTVEYDYEASEVVEPLQPVEDDQLTLNDVTATRIGGSSQRVQVTEGPLSIQPPPDGVGPYDESLSVNAESDGQLADVAGWRTHVGTWDEARYPTISVNLAKPGFTKTYETVTVDVGDVVDIVNPPAFLPPDTISQMVVGSTEYLDDFSRRITWNTVPAGPWTVPTWGSSTDPADEAESPDHYDTAGSVLAVAIDSDDTSLVVATTLGPLWTTSANDLPFNLQLGGEKVTCTSVAQTTIAFRAAGTADSDNNASVTPGLPAGLTAGDLLLGLAGIRGTVATVTVPTGYTTLLDAGNLVLFGRIADGTETTPTVAFIDGSAGDDTVAQLAAFTGTFHDVSNLVVATAYQTNGSAQDIDYPDMVVPARDCLILYLGLKQDDWTSVATIGGATEIGEPDSTAGTDAGLVWDRLIQTTATDIAAGSFTVTGGAAAGSKGAVVAIRSDVQTFTVARSLNQVVKSHTAGTDIRLSPSPIYSL